MCLFIRHNFANCVHTIEQEVVCQLGLCGKIGRVGSHHQGSCSECSGLSPYEAIRQTRIRSDVLMAEPKGLDGGSDSACDDRADPNVLLASEFLQFVSPADSNHNTNKDGQPIIHITDNADIQFDLSDNVDDNYDLSNEVKYCSSDNGHAHVSSLAKSSLADSPDQIPQESLPGGEPPSNFHTQLLGKDGNSGPVRDTRHICKDAADSNWYSRTFKVNKSGGFEFGIPFTVPAHDEALAEAGDDCVYSMYGAISSDETPEPASDVNSDGAHHQPDSFYSRRPISVCQGQAYAPVSHFYLHSHGYMTYAYTPQRLPGYAQPVWIPSPYPVGALLPPGPARTIPPPCPNVNQPRRRGACPHVWNGDRR